MVAQVKMTPMAAAPRAVSNAPGSRAFSRAPNTRITEVMTMPAHGTPDLLILRVNAGACLDTPRLRSTRPVELSPELRPQVGMRGNQNCT